MKILITARHDPAGVGITLKRAFDRYTDFDVRFIRRVDTRFAYPGDLEWDQLRSAIALADVVHMMDFIVPEAEGKPRIIHHHGAPFHAARAANLAAIRDQRLPAFGATHDLTDLTWMPNPCPLDMMAAIRAASVRTGPVKVIQNPSSRKGKQTDLLLAAWPATIIENVSWADSLKAKAEADILFDSFTFGYGNTSIEAWAMGLAVVSGTASLDTDLAIRRNIGFLPYHMATPATLRERIAELVDDRILRDEVAERGRACVERFHDERLVVKRWANVYAEAMG